MSPALDSIDHLLLRLIQEDAGRTLRKLGDLVGLPPITVDAIVRRARDILTAQAG